jgi:hypothetical protein
MRSSAAAFVLLACFCAIGCASASGPLRIERRGETRWTSMAELNIRRGADTVIVLASGEQVRGRWNPAPDGFVEVNTAGVNGVVQPLRFAAHAVDVIALVRGVSRARRACLGAAIGAALSLPFAISMFADMSVPAAIVGSLAGRASGDVRAGVVYERQRP